MYLSSCKKMRIFSHSNIFKEGTFMNNETKKTTKIIEEQMSKAIALDGTKSLRVEKLTITFEVTTIKEKGKSSTPKVSKKRIGEKVETLTFPLKKVDESLLKEYRAKGIPSFVLKLNGKLYHTTIPKSTSFASAKILGDHSCLVIS